MERNGPNQCSNYTVDFGGAHLLFILFLGGDGVFVRLRVDLQLMDFKDCARRSTVNVESNVYMNLWVSVLNMSGMNLHSTYLMARIACIVLFIEVNWV